MLVVCYTMILGLLADPSEIARAKDVPPVRHHRFGQANPTTIPVAVQEPAILHMTCHTIHDSVANGWTQNVTYNPARPHERHSLETTW